MLWTSSQPLNRLQTSISHAEATAFCKNWSLSSFRAAKQNEELKRHTSNRPKRQKTKAFSAEVSQPPGSKASKLARHTLLTSRNATPGGLGPRGPLRGALGARALAAARHLKPAGGRHDPAMPNTKASEASPDATEQHLTRPGPLHIDDRIERRHAESLLLPSPAAWP